MNDTTKTPTVPMIKLRRLAPRAGSVIRAHAPEHAELKPFELTLLPLTQTYVSAYDQRGALEPDESKLVTAGRDAVAHARTRMQAWMPNLRRNNPDLAFEPKQVPEDLFAEIGRVLLLVEARDEATLPYRDALLDDVGSALSEARAAWQLAQRTLAEQQRARARLRGLAIELYEELKALRQTLRKTLGTSHRDYQRLRTARANTPYAGEREPVAADEAAAPEPSAAQPIEEATQLVA
jgi:hypothetical protein